MTDAPYAADVDTLARATRIGALLRVACAPTPLRLWAGQIRDLAIPASGAETTDGAIYQSMGLLTGLPQLSSLLNGEAERVEFILSGAAVTGQVAALAHDGAAEIRGVAADAALILFDDDWQLLAPIFWRWSGTCDSLIIDRPPSQMSGGKLANPVRSLKLSAGSVFSSRRRPNLTFWTPIDQERRSSNDNFCDQVPKLQDGTTKVWGTNG